MTFERLNWDPGEYRLDIPPERALELKKFANERNAHALWGVGAEHGNLAVFGHPHAFEGRMPSSWLMHPTGSVVLQAGVTGRPHIDPKKFAQGFHSWPITDIDPRTLTSTQHGLQLGAMEHYLGEHSGLFDKTRDPEGGNDIPTIVRLQGRNFILTGHHRAHAALFKGVPLIARFKEQ